MVTPQNPPPLSAHPQTTLKIPTLLSPLHLPNPLLLTHDPSPLFKRPNPQPSPQQFNRNSATGAYCIHLRIRGARRIFHLNGWGFGARWLSVRVVRADELVEEGETGKETG